MKCQNYPRVCVMSTFGGTQDMMKIKQRQVSSVFTCPYSLVYFFVFFFVAIFFIVFVVQYSSRLDSAHKTPQHGSGTSRCIAALTVKV